MTRISKYISPYKHVYNYFKNITTTFNHVLHNRHLCKYFNNIIM